MNKNCTFAMRGFFACVMCTALSIPLFSLSVDEAFTVIKKYYLDQNIHSASNGKDVVIDKKLIKMQINTTKNKQKIVNNTYVFLYDQKTSLLVVENRPNDFILFLRRGDDNWLFKNGMRLPMKISMSYSISNEISLYDILGILFVDYVPTGVSEGKTSFILSMSTEKKSIPYPFIDAKIDKKNKSLTSVTFLGASKQAIKELKFARYSLVSGNHRVPEMEIRNLLFKKNDYATVKYVYIRDFNLPGSYFYPNVNVLERLMKDIQSIIKEKS
ncbi:MAG: outer membrane lipoprotein-sorting protein [Chitinivibrionales bacterium]|nr:outer membrane lipoprotein-sorting protein [Chitinivibrionales bacterium]